MVALMSDLSMSGHAQGINNNLSRLITVMENRFPLAAFSGTMTWTAAVTATVTDANVKANSIIILMATDASAGTLEAGAKKPYVSARNVGVSFVLTTADGNAAAGTETFSYFILNVG
jgi:hypothetical protein